MTTPEVRIVLTTKTPPEVEGRPHNSVEVSANGMVLATTYGHDTPSQAYEEAIRYLSELVLAYQQQAM